MSNSKEGTTSHNQNDSQSNAKTKAKQSEGNTLVLTLTFIVVLISIAIGVSFKQGSLSTVFESPTDPTQDGISEKPQADQRYKHTVMEKSVPRRYYFFC